MRREPGLLSLAEFQVDVDTQRRSDSQVPGRKSQTLPPGELELGAVPLRLQTHFGRFVPSSRIPFLSPALSKAGSFHAFTRAKSRWPRHRVS